MHCIKNTLLENIKGLGFVLVSIFTLTLGATSAHATRLVTTDNNLAQAQTALMAYYSSHNNHLPCPAPRNVPLDGPGFGVSLTCSSTATTKGELGDGTARAIVKAPYNIRIGALPVRTLGLPDNLIEDGYGHLLVYAVTEKYADSNTTISGMTEGEIPVEDSSFNSLTAVPGTAAFVLVAPGSDGKGAYNTSTGKQPHKCPATGILSYDCNDQGTFIAVALLANQATQPLTDDIVTFMGSGLPAPVISSAGTATTTTGAAFTYQIVASNSPTSYGASGLPTGLSINTTTGAITGTPTSAGLATITLSATNAQGTGTATLALMVNQSAPVISSVGTATATAGTAFTYQIVASNSPASYDAAGLPTGLSINTTTGAITGTPTTAGSATIALSATNAGGTGTATLALTVNPAAVCSGPPKLANWVGMPTDTNATAQNVFVTAWNNFVTALGGQSPTMMMMGLDPSHPISQWLSDQTGWVIPSWQKTPFLSNVTPVMYVPMALYDSTNLCKPNGGGACGGTNDADTYFQQIISGQWDKTLISVFQAWANAGYKTLYIRPGWEMNGSWYPWSVTSGNVADYVAAFQHIYTLAKGFTAAKITVVWNPSAILTKSGLAYTSFYPGNNYVDVIGVDIYGVPLAADSAPSAVSTGPTYLTLQTAMAFAKQSGKPFSMPEAGGTNANFPINLAKVISATTGVNFDYIGIWDASNMDWTVTAGAPAAWQNVLTTMKTASTLICVP